MDKLECDVLAGIPFCKSNDIHVHMKSESITIGDITIPYGAKSDTSAAIFHLESSCILRNSTSKVIMPGEFVEIQSKELCDFDGEVAIEPRIDSPLSGEWPSPQLSRVIQGTVRIPNDSDTPIRIAKNQHIAQIRRVKSLPNIASPPDAHLVVSDACSPHKSTNQDNYTLDISIDPSNTLLKQ